MPNRHRPRTEDLLLSRRELLHRCGMGFGTLALANLLPEAGAGPLAPRAPQFAATAKRVIHIFANGGPSHVDTFDPKPQLSKFAGKPLPGGNLQTERKTGAALPSPWEFRRYGASGIEVSDLFQQVARHVDDMVVIRSMRAELPNHEPSLMLMNCGDGLMPRPSMGAWVTYGLGTENQNLPSFVVLCPGGLPIKESENWQSAFLPGVYAGTFVDTQHTRPEKLLEHIRNLQLPRAAQRRQLDLIHRLNEEHQQQRPGDPQLEARIQSFELAYRMQLEATDAFDVEREPPAVRARYGDGSPRASS